MSNIDIDTLALREAAEKATWGDWDSYKPHRGARGYEVRLSSQAIAQHVLKNNAEFIAAFNPKVALALLDELERNQQYIKLRDQENEDIALTVGKLRVELEATKKRIAELEARTVVVKQFDDFQIVHYGATEDYAKGYIDCQSNYNKAIYAAGIKVKGE